VKPITEADYQQRIERVTRAIAARPDRSHSLGELARIAHFSPFHFHRVYRAMVGESVIDTGRRLRVEHAARLLATGDSPVTEIAMEVGYDSVQSFSRAFRRVTSVSPREFRGRKIKFADLVDGPPRPRRSQGRIEVEVITRPVQTAWAVLHQGPLTQAPKAYARLWTWQLLRGIAGRTKEAIGICYGDEKGDDGEFRYYAGIIWEQPVEGGDGVERVKVPGGKYANYRLIGSHHGIPGGFERLYAEWLPSSGYLPDDRPALEIYRNNPFDTPANELITDLLLPVK
jgi:AraC family transcriptional regulator